jgi:hypothetical protein
LHAQAKAQVGNFIFARILRGENFAFDAALAKSAGAPECRPRPFNIFSAPNFSISSASLCSISTPQSLATPP